MEEEQKQYKLIRTYLEDIRTSIKRQSDKVEDILILLHRLFELEILFSKKLRSIGAGRKVYFKFIVHVHKSKGGIKTARSYFRARQEIFKDTVNVAIATNNPKLMHDIPINFQFCSYAISNIERVSKSGKPVKVEVIKELENIFENIKKLREEIITRHLYLALSKAKVFGSSFKGMEFEDLIQIANQGLIKSVDKYVHETDISNFHHVAIGKMTAELITDGDHYADVTIGPNDRKKLYTIRRYLQINPEASAEQIAENLEFELDLVKDLLMATKKKSLDDFVSDEQDTRMVDVTSDEDEMSPFDFIENKDLKEKMNSFYAGLSIIEKKVLILKGINLGEMI